MIVINKRSNRFRVKLSVNAKYEDAAESLRRLQKQPVGDNISSIMLNKGVIGLAGADGVNLERIEGGYVMTPRTLPYTTTPKPEPIQKEPFKLWKGLGPNTNRKEH